MPTTLRWCMLLLIVTPAWAQITLDFEETDERFHGVTPIEDGHAGRAARFPGGDARVDVGPCPVSSGRSFTLSVSLRTTRGAFCTPLMARKGERVGLSLVMGRRPGCVSFEAWSWGRVQLISRTRVDDGRWHRVVAEYDAASGCGALSVDGRVEAVAMLGEGASEDAVLRLGNNIGAHQPFEGDLDSLRITDQVENAERFVGLDALPSASQLGERLAAVRARALEGKNAAMTWPDPVEWTLRRAHLRRAVADCLGLEPRPERLPLAPEIHGRVARDGLIVERMSFRSWPGYRATGWLWRSEVGAARRPAVLCPHGHWQDGALNPTVRARGRRFARAGYVVLFVDSVHVEDVASGVNSVGAMTWNNIRAIDYLATRDDVDATRIGVTGASGGAQQTMYLMALEDRLAVAAPICMISEFAEILSDTSAHCGCNHPPRIAWATDEPEMCGLFAPRPVFFGSVTGDWTHRFPERGLPELATVYERYDLRRELRSRHLDAGHNYDLPFRNEVYQLFDEVLQPARRKLMEEPSIFTKEELLPLGPPPRIPPDRDLMVREFLGRRSRVSELKELAPALPWTVPPGTPALGSSRPDGFRPGTLDGFDGVSIPLALRPTESRDALLIVTDRGVARTLISPPSWLPDDRTVAIITLRFTGTSAGFASAWRRNGLVLGRGEAYAIAHDVASAAAALKVPVTVVGLGDGGVAALLAAHIASNINHVIVPDLGPDYLTDGNRTPQAPELLRFGGLPAVIQRLPSGVRVSVGGAGRHVLISASDGRHDVRSRALTKADMKILLR